mgnify:CR=1 FL=1
MTGAYLKVVQQVMRHQSITLTMDTYGHLFPGQEADAVARMSQILVERPSEAKVLRSTRTDDQMANATKGAQRQAQRQAQRAKGGNRLRSRAKWKVPKRHNRESPSLCRLKT